ncbi:MAG: M24 family metallopeptidase [Porticoccaceae bacterium]|nr:M24 family metallopeptidase [Porticoccaceae bacterium]
MYSEKLARLRRELTLMDATGAVFTHSDAVRYFTGFESAMDGWRLPEPMSGVYIPTDSQKPIVLLIPEASLISLLVAERESQPIFYQSIATFDLLNFCVTARAEDVYLKLEQAVGERLGHFAAQIEGDCQPDIIAALSKLLSARGTTQKLIIYDDMRVALRVHESVGQHFGDAFDALFRVRAIKTADEIEIFRQSGRKADRVMAHTVKQLAKGKVWAQIEKSVAHFMIDEDITPLPISPLLFGGTYDLAFKPELFRTLFETPFQDGQIVILETQGEYKNVWIDINRTAHIGDASAEYKEQHALVKHCFDQVIAALKPGNNSAEICRRVAATAAQNLDAPGKLLLIVHSIGAVPLESPVAFPSTGLAATEGFTIQPSMILSFDCLYFGSKLGPTHMENVFEITTNGAQSLYQYPLDLIEV